MFDIPNLKDKNFLSRTTPAPQWNSAHNLVEKWSLKIYPQILNSRIEIISARNVLTMEAGRVLGTNFQRKTSCRPPLPGLQSSLLLCQDSLHSLWSAQCRSRGTIWSLKTRCHGLDEIINRLILRYWQG